VLIDVNCIFHAKITCIKLVILPKTNNNSMSLIHKQVKQSLKTTNESYNNAKVSPLFKHFLKCKSCLWKVTFYESPSSNSTSINSKKIRCPVCKEKEMNSTKIKIIS
jgi:hypothetical protein